MHIKRRFCSYVGVCIITLVDCGSLANVTNGQVSFITTFGGSVANYTCNRRHRLCGAESRTCQSNGSWSGSPPDCISNSCVQW